MLIPPGRLGAAAHMCEELPVLPPPPGVTVFQDLRDLSGEE